MCQTFFCAFFAAKVKIYLEFCAKLGNPRCSRQSGTVKHDQALSSHPHKIHTTQIVMADYGTLRYSDEELEEFRTLLLKKYDQAKEQLASMLEQINEITENSSDDHGGDWMDDSSMNTEVEMLNTMAIRQRKYIKDLENALIRIKNKSYGICVVTGELIEKRRLLAVPTTTKSVVAKNDEKKVSDEKEITKPSKNPYVRKVDVEDEVESDEEEESTPRAKQKPTPVIITKVIRKSGGNKAANAKPQDDDDLDFAAPYDDDDFDLEDKEEEEDDNIDFDNIADSDSVDDDY